MAEAKEIKNHINFEPETSKNNQTNKPAKPVAKSIMYNADLLANL